MTRKDEIRFEKASAWFLRIQAGLDAHERQNLLRWLGEAPENAAAMELVHLAWERAPEALAANPVPRPARAARRARYGVAPARRPRLAMAAAAALVIAVTGAAYWRAVSTHHLYQTVRGQMLAVDLPDGTHLVMAPMSRVAFDGTLLSRALKIEAGRVDIQVAPSWRAFHAGVDTLDVKDIGTRFLLEKTGDGASVVLVSGRVALYANRKALGELSPGERADWRGGALKITVADLDAEKSWESGRLIFDNTPLGEALAEFERYNMVRFSVAKDDIRAIRVSGVFHATDVESFLRSLRHIYGVAHRKQGGGYRLSRVVERGP